jgi:hypothetical protein
MKTRITSIFALASTLLLFSACEKDALVDSLAPEYTNDVTAEMRSSEFVKFEIWQQVDILQPDCGDPIMTNDTEEDGDEISKSSGCMGTYGLTSDEGQGWTQDYGRLTSIVELKFDASTNQVDGTIEFKFPADNDMLVLKALGKITRDASSDEGTTIMVHILSMKGTGRFANVNFSGSLTIMEADQIFDGDVIDYYATIYIKGAFGK